MRLRNNCGRQMYSIEFKSQKKLPEFFFDLTLMLFFFILYLTIYFFNSLHVFLADYLNGKLVFDIV